MAFLSQLTFAQLQQAAANAYNANASTPANLGPGSSMGAFLNAFALLALELQSQTAYVNSASRLATSENDDVDSFVAPFGITRDPAVASSGTVTFSTPSTVGVGQQLVIAVGTQVQSPSGIIFNVVADTGQPGYSSSNNGYLITSGNNSVNATVIAANPGSAGNVAAGTINQILSSAQFPAPPGVNSVTNAQAFTNGQDKETDTALKLRFANFMASRFATIGAIATAVAGVQSNLTYQIGDMLDQNGNAKPNFITVIVNVIGQNSAEADILSAVNTAVQNSRPAGIPYQVINPTLVPVNISATLTIAPGSNAALVNQNAATAVQTYLNNIGMNVYGATTRASFSQITTLLMAVAGVSNVTNLTLNSGTSDITAGFGSQIVSGSTTFSN